MSTFSILFICPENAARSQMAEGLLRHHYGDHYDIYSAGCDECEPVHPLAIQAMREIGVDISEQTSKHLDDFAGRSFDYVATVCDAVHETCPEVPARVQNMHYSFPDPTAARGSEQEQLNVFCRVRNEIDAWIKEAFDPAQIESA